MGCLKLIMMFKVKCFNYSNITINNNYLLQQQR